MTFLSENRTVFAVCHHINFLIPKMGKKAGKKKPTNLAVAGQVPLIEEMKH
jgi:hypothetical protein